MTFCATSIIQAEGRRKQRVTGRQNATQKVNDQETWILSKYSKSLFCQNYYSPYHQCNLCDSPGYPSCSIAVMIGANVDVKTQVLKNRTLIMVVIVIIVIVAHVKFIRLINFSWLPLLHMKFFPLHLWYIFAQSLEREHVNNNFNYC